MLVIPGEHCRPKCVREHNRKVRDVQAAMDAGGRGYRPAKRMVRTLAKAKTNAEEAEMLRTSGELDPLSNTCAARALEALELSNNVDFDEGVRIIKGGLRDATVGDKVLNALQDEVISKHKTDNRDAGGRCNGLPKDFADVLGTDFHLLPHELCGNMHHLRGSFPQAVKAAGT